MISPLMYFHMGDEDRALSHHSEAAALAEAGIPGAQLSDGTTIDISNGVAYINSPMLAEYIVLAPRQEDAGRYSIDLYGYSHRGDAMIPQGQMHVYGDYSHVGYPDPSGAEIYHFGDGIALHMVGALPDSTLVLRDVYSFVIVSVLMSPVEDLQSQLGDQGTVQGFLSYSNAILGFGSYNAQGKNHFSASTYGVDRMQQFPVFMAAVSFLDPGSNPIINQTYNSGNSSVDYQVVGAEMLRITAGKDVTAGALAYSFGTDILQYYEPGNVISAPFPIIIPLGNNRVVLLGRIRNPDASLIFGGTFSITAKYFSGTTGVSSAVLAVTGIITGHFSNNAWSCGPTTQATFDIPTDFLRSMYLFKSLATTQRDCVPISQDETLLFGLREMIDVSDPGGNLKAAWVCFSVTSNSVTVKGTLSLDWGEFSDNTKTRKMLNYVGATHDDVQGVYVFFHVYTAAISENFVFQGLYRYYSDDDGTTWDAGTLVTLDYGNPEQTPPYAYMLSPPKWIGNTDTDSKIIIMGYTEGVQNGTATTLQKTTIQSSSDGGVNFTISPVGTADLNYNLPAGAFFYHTPRGLTSVQEFGNHEDGYAPSPYRHLPTYYGTPTKASRDASNDAGL